MESEEKKYTGYGYHGGGRKATGIKRVCFQVSCQPEEAEFIKNKAKELGITTSKLVLEAVKAYK